MNPSNPITPDVPAAVALPNSPLQRAWARLTRPPRFAANRLTWSLSGALLVSSIHVITMLGFDLCGCEQGDGSLGPAGATGGAGFVDSVLVAIGALFLSLVLFPPFRLSAGLYLFFFERPSRRTAVPWSVAFHLTAHLLTLSFLGLGLTTNLWVPLVIATVWGLWLPRLMDRERESGELPWHSPSGRG
jgi:hypothetical protein